MVSHSKFGRNLIWQSVLQLLKYVLPLATLPYLTRVLQPSIYAMVGYVAAVMAYVQVFVDFGFTLSGTKRIAVADNGRESGRVLGEITAARIALAGIALSVVLILIWRVPILHENPMFVLISFLAVCGRAMLPDFVFQGKEEMGPITVRYLLTKSMSTVLTFALIDSPDDVLWVPILDLLGSAVSVAWSMAVIRRRFGILFELPSFVGVRRELRRSALYCFSNVAATSLSAFVTLMIGICVPDRTELAYWALSMTAVSAFQSLYNPIVNALYPHVVVTRDFLFVRRIGLLAAPVVGSATVIFGVFSGEILSLIGGESYRGGAYVASFLSPLLLFSFYALLYGWPLLGAAGRVGPLTSTTVGAAVFCVLCVLLLVWLQAATIVWMCVVRVLTELVLMLSRVALGREHFVVQVKPTVA